MPVRNQSQLSSAGTAVVDDRSPRNADSGWVKLAAVEQELNPDDPILAAPGSMEKVMMLQARYAAGVPLWDSRDSYDHSSDNVGMAGDDVEEAQSKKELD
mgnify:CR=1 FL=1